MATLRSLDREIEVQPLRQWPTGYERTPEHQRKRDPFHMTRHVDAVREELEGEDG